MRDHDRSALALFAEELRAAREKAAVSREDLSSRINYSTALVEKVESMDRVPQADFAARCDAALDTPGTFYRLQKRLRDLPFPIAFRPFAGYEAVATSLRTFEHSLVPGLLQTSDYARAVLLTRPNTTSDEIDELVTVRLGRQRVIERSNPPLLWVLIDEAVLYREVGNHEVMRGQLRHLAEMSLRPNITIQVVPFTAGAHSGLRGAFIIAGFDNAPSIVYLATAADGETIEEPSAVATILLTFDTLRSEALTRGASRDLIMRVAEEQWK